MYSYQLTDLSARKMTESSVTGSGPAKLSLSTGGGSRDGRLVISGVKAGDGNGPRVFLLSAVKADRPGDGSASTPAGRVSLLRTGDQPPGSHSKTFTTDTSVQGKRLNTIPAVVLFSHSPDEVIRYFSFDRNQGHPGEFAHPVLILTIPNHNPNIIS